MRELAIALSLTLAGTSAPGAALALREWSVASRGGDVQVRCYSAPGAGALPVVVLLHGASGFGPFSRHYESYAESLAEGFRTCAVLYYSASDSRVLAGRQQAAKSALFRKRFMSWLATINDVVDGLSKLPMVERESMGVLGFSQGAYLAVGVAGTNRRIKALAEFYGGFPGPLESQIRQLPPTLIVHGGSDTVIPVQEAQAWKPLRNCGRRASRRSCRAERVMDSTPRWAIPAPLPLARKRSTFRASPARTGR